MGHRLEREPATPAHLLGNLGRRSIVGLCRVQVGHDLIHQAIGLCGIDAEGLLELSGHRRRKSLADAGIRSRQALAGMLLRKAG
jgi:hypothetical protein